MRVERYNFGGQPIGCIQVRAVFVAEEKMAAAAAGNRKSGLLEKVSKSVNGFS